MARAFDDDEAGRVRARLLEAGRRSVARVGFRRTRIEDLTREAGIAKGSFYRFFETKEELLVEVMREGEQVVRSRLLAACDLRSALFELFVGVEAHPLLAALTDPEDFAWLGRSLPPGVFEAAQADDERWFSAWIEALQAKGWMRADVDREAVLGLPSLALAAAQGRAWMAPERRMRVVAGVVDGLVAVWSVERGAGD